MTRQTEKRVAYFSFSILLFSLLPIMLLGYYNHPTGDDYYYGASTHLVWEETGSFSATITEAAKGVAKTYQEWQGTYSAMFLMYLAPNIFSQTAYKWVTTVILLLLSGSLFWLLKPVICYTFRGSDALWIAVSSLLSLLWIETVPSQSETFFWYNGSMYYTGFFAVTLFYFGLLLRYLQSRRGWHFPLLTFLALFLAGGNYVSFLPALLLMICLFPALLLQKSEGPASRTLSKKNAFSIAILILLMLAGFAVSAAAPGNAVRGQEMAQTSFLFAIAKSLLQGIRYTFAWINIWWILTALILTPFLWDNIRYNYVPFRYPILVCGFVYGIFCSMSCPTFYTMNSTGPARAVSIVYYAFVLATFFCYYYLLGAFCRFLQKKEAQAQAAQRILQNADTPPSDSATDASRTSHKSLPNTDTLPSDSAIDASRTSHKPLLNTDTLPSDSATDASRTSRKFSISKISMDKRLIWAGFFLLLVMVSLAFLLSGWLPRCTTAKAVRLVTNGEAAAYEKEHQDRLAVLTDPSVKNVKLLPYQCRPDMLYVGDFEADPDTPTNRAVARYFRKNSIFVDYNAAP